MPPTTDHPVDDEPEDPSPSTDRPPSVILDLVLPATVDAVKKKSKGHSLYSYKKLAGDFRFSHWCVLVPHPLSLVNDAEEPEAQASAFLIAQRKALGDSLPNDVLLVNLVDSSGQLNVAVGADITRALGYTADQAPLVIFTDSPRLRIYQRYDNMETFGLKRKQIDGVALSLGGVSKSALGKVIKTIPKVFKGETPDFEELNKQTRQARAATTRRRRLKRTLKIATPVVTVLGAIGKFILSGHP